MSLAPDEQTAAVRVILERYIDAVYHADVEMLRGTFHPSAHMSGYLGDDLLVGGPEPFFADVGSRPSMAESGADYKARITSLEVSGRAASATLEESGFFGSMRFVNYFVLLAIDGEWQIVAKTFASL